MRLQFWEANGVRVLDDAYNANADSMIAALETLCDLPLQGRRVAVLGDMAELGAHSEAAHAEVGRRAAELGIGQLFAVGKMAPVMAKAARDAGLNRVIEFADVEAAVKAVKEFFESGRRGVVEGVAGGAAGTHRRNVEVGENVNQDNALLLEPEVAGLGARDGLGGPPFGAAAVPLHHGAQRGRGGHGAALELVARTENHPLAEDN